MKSFFAWVAATSTAFARAIGRLVARTWRAFARLVVALWRSRATRWVGRTTWTATRVAAWTVLFAGVTLAGGYLGFRHVPPGYAGVKQSNFGGDGIEARDYATGLHFAPRVLDEWHLVDLRTQLLSFAWNTEGGEHPMLEVRTKDGNVAQIGVSVPYRVKTGEASALVRDGLKHAWKQRVKSTVEKVLSSEFGAFTFASLTDTDQRLALLESALPRLNESLAPLHVRAERILVTHVFFGMEFEKKLQQTQLTRQTALMLDATTELEKQRQATNLFQDGIDAAEKRIRVELETEIARVLAAGREKIVEAYGAAKEYDRTRRNAATAEAERLIAEGDRAMIRAQQEKEELANEVYDSAGGRLMLARQAAENLNIRQVTLNSNDPRVPSILDLNELVALLIGSPKR